MPLIKNDRFPPNATVFRIHRANEHCRKSIFFKKKNEFKPQKKDEGNKIWVRKEPVRVSGSQNMHSPHNGQRDFTPREKK